MADDNDTNSKAGSSDPTLEEGRPISLRGHAIDETQIASIRAHVAAWSETALTISDRLPIGADSTDVFRALRPKERS